MICANSFLLRSIFLAPPSVESIFLNTNCRFQTKFFILLNFLIRDFPLSTLFIVDVNRKRKSLVKDAGTNSNELVFLAKNSILNKFYVAIGSEIMETKKRTKNKIYKRFTTRSHVMQCP